MPSGVFLLIGFCLGVCITVIAGLVRVLTITLKMSGLKIELLRHEQLARSIKKTFFLKHRALNPSFDCGRTENQEMQYNQGAFDIADRMVESFEKKGK